VEKGINSLNVVRLGAREVEVVPHRLAQGATEFLPVEPILLPRHRAGSTLT
jgi:hypothetical protein